MGGFQEEKGRRYRQIFERQKKVRCCSTDLQADHAIRHFAKAYVKLQRGGTTFHRTYERNDQEHNIGPSVAEYVQKMGSINVI